MHRYRSNRQPTFETLFGFPPFFVLLRVHTVCQKMENLVERLRVCRIEGNIYASSESAFVKEEIWDGFFLVRKFRGISRGV